MPVEPLLPRQLDRRSKHRGEYWVQEAPGVRFGGTLRFENGRPHLVLREPLEGGAVSDFLVTETLQGELHDGTPVTLWRKSALSRPLDWSKRWRRHHLMFDWALIGTHEDDIEEARFAFWGVVFQSLAPWSQIAEPLPPETEESKRPQHAPARVSMDGHDLTFWLRDPERRSSSEAPQSEWGGHRTHFLVDVHPPAEPKYLDVISFDLQARMTFSYQRAARVTAEFCAHEGDSTMIEIIRELPVGAKERSTNRDEMVLTPAGLPFDRLIEAWWPAVGNIYPVTQVLSKEFYFKGGFIEASASAAVAATERMHEQVGRTKAFGFPSGFLKAKRKRLRDTFTEEKDAAYLEYLLSCRGPVRPTLEVKLTELACALGDDVFDAVGVAAKDWISSVKTPRNNLAHTGSHVLQRGTDASDDLRRVDAHTRAFLTLVVLQYMGLPKSRLLEAADNLRQLGTLRLNEYGINWAVPD
ncbi:hypothetical protein [Plantibacter sp. YIM 135347]|uniref:hypothetical protein n=1 Tax=Plantibacter sp. YIM 135347 TaxID=3423919 RepID=UPI003D33790B